MLSVSLVTTRITGPFQGRYWIKAQVRRIDSTGYPPLLVSQADVFDHHPDEGGCLVGVASTELQTADPLDMLQPSERLARDTIDALYRHR